MGGSCRLVRAGTTLEARWRRDGDALVVSPAGQPAVVVALERVSGISGDGHALRLRLPDGDLGLERLGADGPTLLGELRRDWPVMRAKALRLDDGGAPAEVFSGSVVSAGLRGPFRGYLAGARLLACADGGDVVPLFLADVAAVTPDQDARAVRCAGWEGGETVFGKLGAKADAFAAALLRSREALARDADAAISRHLPTLGAAARASLAAAWLPGRLLASGDLERLAPGFEAGFDATWLAGLPRAAEGRRLTAGVEPGRRYLGYAPPEGGGDAAPMLWLLARRPDAWYLEVLSHGDHATYLFRGDEVLPGLVETLIRLPEFSREALYLPVEELVGHRAVYAIPARDLPWLRELRELFLERRIHTGASAE